MFPYNGCVVPPIGSRSPLARPPAQAVALIKPQFEAGRRHLKKGIVRDSQVHAEVCANVRALVHSLGWTVRDVVASPIAGSEGNREFLIGACAGATCD
jgi:23S rRNA (cytidine1920-2'-O)/16S rRNA (cytidine1409-2'-O)-methyltransferase